MKLFEHPDFDQAVIRAAEYFQPRGLQIAFIEKDYYVTEALRIIAASTGDKVIFKGGTSLSKGWNLIQRFSEDIDIFLDPTAYSPILRVNFAKARQVRMDAEEVAFQVTNMSREERGLEQKQSFSLGR